MISNAKYFYLLTEEGKLINCKINYDTDCITEIGFTENGFYRSINEIEAEIEDELHAKMIETSAAYFHQIIIDAATSLTGDMEDNLPEIGNGFIDEVNDKIIPSY